MGSKIEWTDETWNPVTGCTKISQGCLNCYAERLCYRFWKQWDREPPPNHFKVKLHPDRLNQPLRWKKPRRIFVCSMSDFFHPEIPLEFQVQIFSIIRRCPQHIFQILTKRQGQLAMMEYACGIPKLPNMHLLVSAENQLWADRRIPELLKVPAAVHGVSVEPMLGPMNLAHYLHGMPEPHGGGHIGYASRDMAIDAGDPSLEGMDLGWREPEWHQTTPPLHWVIIGCESGPNRRPMELQWARDLVEQCRAANVPVFVKQLDIDGRVSKDPAEWPKDLRVREYP